MNKVTLTVPEDMIRRAKAKAALEGLSLSAVVREFLERWIDPEKVVYALFPKEPSP